MFRLFCRSTNFRVRTNSTEYPLLILHYLKLKEYIIFVEISYYDKNKTAKLLLKILLMRRFGLLLKPL